MVSLAVALLRIALILLYDRTRSLTRRLLEFVRSLVRKVEFSVRFLEESIRLSLPSSCTRPLEIGQSLLHYQPALINEECNRFHAIMVDNGVLRMNEATQVHKMLCEDLGVNLTVIDSSELFLGKLKGILDPEQKRKIIGNTFIEVFEEEAERLDKKFKAEGGEGGEIEWLLQGTLYPDVIESISFKGPSATIKTHHNVGGLLDNMKLKLIEPLRELFKGSSSPFLSTTLANFSYSQTRYELSDDCSTFPPISSVDTPSRVQDSPFES